MSESDNECIFVESNTLKSLINDYDNGECASDSESVDSSFSILDRTTGHCPSLTTACQTGGEPLEQRGDIILTKEIPNKIEKLTFKDSNAIEEVLERVKARENLDQDIENEINNLKSVQANKKLVNENLTKAARVALENVEIARKKASDGQTTVKRAMEVIENAFPVFLEACNKSFEENKLNDEVSRQLSYYEQCQRAEKQAAYDIDMRQQKEGQALEHLNMSIELSEKDLEKISKKAYNEETQERLLSFKAVGKEIEDIVSNEFEEVDGWLISCKSDLEVIDLLQNEQKERFITATKSYEQLDKSYDMKISLNKTRQEELNRQLSEEKRQERKLIEDQAFQKEVQARAKLLHDNVTSQMTELQRSILGIQNRAKTCQQVMESMNICGKELLDASVSAEEAYIAHLKNLETEAMTRYRFALATKAVEKKITIENSYENILDYKERMKVLQEELKKAVQRNQRLVAEQTRDKLKEFNQEKKKEQEIHKDAEDNLKCIMEKLEKCDAELVKRHIHIESVDTLYDIRKQEMEISLAEGYSSLELSDAEYEEEEE